jgi:hypothetical protein
MKFVEARALADPEVAARKIVESRQRLLSFGVTYGNLSCRRARSVLYL